MPFIFRRKKNVVDKVFDKKFLETSENLADIIRGGIPPFHIPKIFPLTEDMSWHNSHEVQPAADVQPATSQDVLLFLVTI